MTEPGERGLNRAYVYVVYAALVGLVLMPLTRDKRYDSFPWSSYPMFAHTRKTTKTVVHHAVGRTAKGARRLLPPKFVANDEVLQAAATIRGAIRRGRRGSSELCKSIAARVAADPVRAAIVTHVEVVTNHYDSIEFFAGDTTPRKSRLHARCRVPVATQSTEAGG